jgi:hypothetical protein
MQLSNFEPNLTDRGPLTGCDQRQFVPQGAGAWRRGIVRV